MIETQEHPVDRKSLEQVVDRAGNVSFGEASSDTQATWVQKAEREFRLRWIRELSRYANEILDSDQLVAKLRSDLQQPLNAPGAAESLIPHIERVLNTLESYANEARAARRHSQGHPELYRMADIVLENAARLYEITERMRWELLEAQADEDIAAERHQSFPDIDSTLASLRKPGE